MAPKVLIIGGGIAGLTLAHGLKKYNIPFHVFEKDRTEHYRAQGYRIRVGGPAVDALEYLLDKETFDDIELSCAEMRMADIPEIDAETAEVVEPKVGQEVREAMRKVQKAWCIDRGTFREVLIKHLQTDDISYDKIFKYYEEKETGVTAHFADGSTVEGTLIVGAEGRSSAVRRQLVPGLEIADTGLRCLYGKTPLTEEVMRTLVSAAGERMSFIKDRTHEELAVAGLEPISFPRRAEMEAKGLACPPAYLFWAMTGTPAAMGITNEHKYLSIEESEQQALQISKKWHPGLRTIMEHQQKGETAAFALTAVNAALPVWEVNERVTVMGDAIHPMAPTGSGAVTAMRDAHMLCMILVERGQSKDAIWEYEEDMRAAAGKVVGTSWAMVSRMAQMTKRNEVHVGEMAMTMRAKNVGGVKA